MFAMVMEVAFSDTTRLWDSVRKNEEWCRQLLRILRKGIEAEHLSRPMKRLKTSEDNSFVSGPGAQWSQSGFVIIEGEVLRTTSGGL